MAETAGEEAEAPLGPSREFYSDLSLAARRILLSYAVAFATVIAIILVLVAALGASIAAAMGADVLATLGIATLAVLALILVAGLIASFYLLYRAASTLKSAVEREGGVVEERLGLAAKILYYSALLNLAGIATLIVLVGVFLLLVGSVGWIVGLIILGVQLREMEPEFSTPGLLVALGAGLRLIGSILGIVALAGIIIEIVGLYTVMNAARRLAGEA
jgi:hypothetical protein